MWFGSPTPSGRRIEGYVSIYGNNGLVRPRLACLAPRSQGSDRTEKAAGPLYILALCWRPAWVANGVRRPTRRRRQGGPQSPARDAVCLIPLHKACRARPSTVARRVVSHPYSGCWLAHRGVASHALSCRRIEKEVHWTTVMTPGGRPGGVGVLRSGVGACVTGE